MDLPRQSLPNQTALAALLLSATLHYFAISALVAGPLSGAPEAEGPILPAFYLYAYDRRPGAPREIRIPIPAPPGVPGGPFAAPTLPADFGNAAVPLQPATEGLLPAGVSDMRLDSVFSAIEVDSEVVRLEWSAAPIYPDSLMFSGTEGMVEAEFVVDTTGGVDLSTVRILITTHPGFSESVESALAGMMFRPALRGLRRVRQLVHQRFSFRIVPTPRLPAL